MTACRACDGPSCRFVRDSISLRSLWRPVVPTTVRPALPSRRSENRSLYQILKSWSVLKRWIMTVRRACYGPSCRSVTEFRESNSLKSLWRSVVPTTVRPALPSRSSESCSQYPIFQNSKCFGTRHPRRSVVPMTVRRGIRRLRQLLPENNSTAQND